MINWLVVLFNRSKSFATARRVRESFGQLLTKVLAEFGILLSFGLIAAVGALLLFYALAQQVNEGNTRQVDEAALAVVNRFASPRLTFFMRVVTYLGSNEFLIYLGAYIVIAFALVRWKRAMITFLITMAGAAVLNFTLKMSFGRERPEPFFGIPQPESYSFPSGHALFSFCFYGVLAAVITARIEGTGRRIAVWVSAAIVVTLIGFSRIYLGVHYPSDVLAAYFAAFIWLVIVASTDRLMRARVNAKDRHLPRTD